ncbi:bestrophin family ion channel [Flavobacterium sp.]|uniref:bestrophin family protein n=1 Tax=Flavobacterium sp. TaxID=239 RepID=UPI0026288964|nr:bestrophin family ion channel [Flavobacterium sp.]
MFAKRNYGFWMTFKWSKMPFIYGGLYAAIIYLAHLLIYTNFNIDISLPWSPVGVVGIAVAFYLGFKNNASYDRSWEARKIWGGIVNNSRSFGAALLAFINGQNEDEIRKKLLYRHIAWLTALRVQLRLSREWEHVEDRIKVIFAERCPEYDKDLALQLEPYLDKTEIDGCIGKSNVATQIMALQALEFQKLRDLGYFDDFRHMEFHKLICSFYDDQGRSERIKNFPFPRQYASAALWLSIIFAALTPLGLLDVLKDFSHNQKWIIIPISSLTIWIFFLMEKIGDYSENPFEGTYNDIPINSISRAIEIDLREMISDNYIPGPVPNIDGYIM